jgi:hypothetical protein
MTHPCLSNLKWFVKTRPYRQLQIVCGPGGWFRNRVHLDFIHTSKPVENPYVAYCTPLDDCGKIRFEAARS